MAAVPSAPPRVLTPAPAEKKKEDCAGECLICIMCVGIIAAVVLMAIYIPINTSPHSPEFQVSSLNTTIPFTLKNNQNTSTITPTPYTLSVGFNLSLWIGNPSQGTLYQNANVSIYYRDFLIASTNVESFCPGFLVCAKGTPESRVPVTMNADSVPMVQDLTAFMLNSDIKRQEVDVTITVTGDYRWKHNSHSQLKVTCNDITVGVSTGVMLGGPMQCKVHWDSNRR